MEKAWEESVGRGEEGKRCAGRLPMATRGGGAAPTGHLACPRLGNRHRHYGKAASLQIVWLTRRAREARTLSTKRPTSPQCPLCGGDELGAHVTVLGRVGPKKALERAAGGGQASGKSQIPLEVTLGDALVCRHTRILQEVINVETTLFPCVDCKFLNTGKHQYPTMKYKSLDTIVHGND
jgi:hypothetical protein